MAPATFQHVMNMVVGEFDGCAVYLDDVVIYGDSFTSHVLHIHHLFERLAAASLTVNLAKCEFAHATVTWWLPPLTDLLKTSVKYVRSPICQQAFQNVKALLCSAPVLAAPCVEKPLKVQVDASQSGQVQY